MKILAIETSCDETALALVEARPVRDREGSQRASVSNGASGGLFTPKFKVLKSAITSQIKVHIPFGGVVPNLAKREHIKNLPILLGQIFGDKGNVIRGMEKIDIIAVTVGPGLEPALWAGIEFAKKLGKEWGKPVVGANHMEGHLYSFLLPKKSITHNLSPITCFPAIALLVSGGHTILLRMDNLQSWKKLGETRDDAVGEAFDKVARLLELPYPGGPEIERIAREGNPNAIPFPRPMINDRNYDFSFSGLKTAVLYFLKNKLSTNNESIANKRIKHKNEIRKFEKDSLFADVASSFQEAAVDVLATKTMRAVKEFGAKSVFLAGGVAANKYLRNRLSKEAKKNGANFFAPDFKYNTDNAAMIAAAAYMATLRQAQGIKKKPLVARGNMGI